MDKVKELWEGFSRNQKIGVCAGAAAVVLSLIIGIVVLVSGGSNSGDNAKAATYTIEVLTEGGMALQDLDIRVYADEKLEDLMDACTTDETGKTTFEAKGAAFYLVIEEVPRGYKAEASYKITEKDTQIVLSAQLLAESELEGVTFKLGDVFADMSVTATDGKTYKISELLKEKKAVVLNFWYLNCDPCKSEFPYLETAYMKYKDSIEVVAINPVDGDDASIKALQESLKLTFPMGKIDAKWESLMQISAYPTTVIIDRFGAIGMIHTGAITEEGLFEKAFNYFTADAYTQSTVRNISDIETSGDGDGTQGFPFEIIGTTFDAKVPAEGLVYYQMYKVDGMVLTIADPDAYVIYGDKEYKAENGVVNVPLVTPDTYTPAKFAIGNASKTEKTFKADLAFPQGSQGNPITLALGEFTANVVAGNDQGVYYTYTATEDGVLTITMQSATAGVKYDYSLYNLNSYAMRMMSTEGTTDATGKQMVTIDVKAGEVVQVTVSTLPTDENEYPAGEFKLMASFKAGAIVDDTPKQVEYSVTVKDANGKAISGVTVNISGTGIENQTIKTDSKGVAKVTLAAGEYTAIVSAPSGYKMDSTEYKLTADKPSVTVKLQKKSSAQKTYTVKVIDESGKAISGALVTVGDSFASTSSNGVVSFKLVENNYTATASANGYQTASKAFGSDTSVTITLKKEAANNPTVTKKTYTVEVVDYNGNPIKDTAVSFLSGGKTVAMAVVGSNGKASASLEAGNYTVEVKFPTGMNYGFDHSTTSLTSSKTSTKVIAAPKANTSDTTSVYDGEYVFQNVYTGGTYLELQAKGHNFVVFKPTRSGKYTISTTDKNAKVASAGTTNYVIESPSYDSNKHTFNVYEDQVNGDMCVIFSVTGASECVLVIERTGSETGLTTYKDYTAKKTPTAFTLSGVEGKTQKYVDVTASSFNIVLGSDGYYHKDSATGPIIYVVLNDKAQYVSMRNLVDNGPLRNPDLGEDYTACMTKYVDCVDKTYGVYPLTEDLKYMFQQGGKAKGWWDKSVEAGYYLFGNKTVNKDIAWMFECCWWE